MKVIAFTIADNKNLEYAKMCEKSFKFFHPEIPFIIYGQTELDTIKDPEKFYKATPLFARDLIQKFDLVLKLDADSLVLGNLNHIINDETYEIGSVLNINRVDPGRYGFVTIQGILPNEYVNNGFVAMRSKEFVNHWWKLCNSPQFNRFQYREQDLLNILFYFGGYSHKVFDYFNPLVPYHYWHGLVAKGETMNCKLIGDDIIIPRGKDNYPDTDVTLKIYHYAGGQNEIKMDYQKHFPEEIVTRINEILGK